MKNFKKIWLFILPVTFVLIFYAGFLSGKFYQNEKIAVVQPTNELFISDLECNFECPEFIGSVDFEGNGSDFSKGYKSMTAVLVRTAMTHQAGKVIVISKGKKVYETSELPDIYAEVFDISKEEGDYRQGLEISFSKDVYSSDPGSFKVYFENGKFIEKN